MQVQEQEFREAIRQKDLQKIQTLLSQGVNLQHLEDTRFGSFLQQAILTNKPEIVEALLKAGANVDLSDKTGELPLITAIEQNAVVEIIRLILQAGPNLSARVRNTNLTVLQYIGFECSSPTIKEYFTTNYPEILTLRDHENCSILFSLRTEEDIRLVERLRKTAPAHIWESLIGKTNKNQTWLHMYARDSSQSVLQIAKILLESGLDVNSQDYSGQTALHLAVTTPRGDNVPLISLLLKHGANPNIRDAHGNSPFHLVIKYDRFFKNTVEPFPGLFLDGSKRSFIIQVFELLVLHGAQLDLKDEGVDFHQRSGQSKTAVDLISMDFFLRLIRNLKKHALYVLVQTSPPVFISDCILTILRKKSEIPASSYIGLMKAMGADLKHPGRFNVTPKELLAREEDIRKLVTSQARIEEFKLLVHDYINTKIGLGIRDDGTTLTGTQNEGPTTIVSLPLELLFKTIDEMGGKAPSYVKELAQVCVFGLSMRPSGDHSETQKRSEFDQQRYDTLLALVLKIKSPAVLKRLIHNRVIIDSLHYLLVNQSVASLANLIYHGLNLSALIPNIQDPTIRQLFLKKDIRTYLANSLDQAEKTLLFSIGKEYLNVRLSFSFDKFNPTPSSSYSPVTSNSSNIYSLPLEIFIKIIDLMFEDVPVYLRRLTQALIFPLESLLGSLSFSKDNAFPSSGNALKRYHSHLKKLLQFKEPKMIKRLVEASHDLAQDVYQVTSEISDTTLTKLVKQELSERYPDDSVFAATPATAPSSTTAVDLNDFSDFYGLFEQTTSFHWKNV